MARVKGIKQAVLEYFTANADRPITLNELERTLNGYTRSQVTQAAASLTGQYAKNLERTGSGVYTWHSMEQETTVLGNEFIVKVIDRDGDALLVQDTETSEVFIMEPINWKGKKR